MCERTHYADRANRFTVFSLAPYRRVQRLHGYIADLIGFFLQAAVTQVVTVTASGYKLAREGRAYPERIMWQSPPRR